jgi:protein phosphatase-4 regulatory subunit 3
MNDPDVLGYILRDQVFLKVVGILECIPSKTDDKEYPAAKADYREFISNQSQFKMVLPIENEEIVERIKQNYRLQFLKDVVLARNMPDTTFSALHSMNYFNNVDIITYFYQNTEFLDKLFALFGQDDVSRETRKQIVMFLYELFTVVKTLQKNNQMLFYAYFA